MRKITYTLEYNNESRTWCVFKNIQNRKSFNFYAIFEDRDFKRAKAKYKEVRK